MRIQVKCEYSETTLRFAGFSELLYIRDFESLNRFCAELEKYPAYYTINHGIELKTKWLDYLLNTDLKPS